MPKTFHNRGRRADNAAFNSRRGSSALDNAWYITGMVMRTGKENVADKISALAEAARDYSKSVALPDLQGYVTFAAESLEGLSDYVAETDLDEMVEEADQFARRHPWAVMGAGLAGGIMAAQVLRMNFSNRRRSAPGDGSAARRRRPARKAGRAQSAKKTNGKTQASA